MFIKRGPVIDGGSLLAVATQKSAKEKALNA